MAQRPRTVAVDVDAPQATSADRTRPWTWWLVAVLSGVGVAVAGWILVAGVTTLVWLSASQEPWGQALDLATRIFALGQGARVELLGRSLSLTPLGLGILQIFLALPLVARAARAAAQIGSVQRRVWCTGAVYAASYVVTVLVLVAAMVDAATASRTLLGAALIGLIAGLSGAAQGLRWDPTESWPQWLRAVPRAIAAAMLALLIFAAVVLTIVLWRGRGEIAVLTDTLQPDLMGVIALSLLHLLYLPNLLLWMLSWLLGAGITLGDGSALTLTTTDVGFLPVIPVLAVVPDPGVGQASALWWLAGGVAAGALAGIAVVWSRPRARFDETALVGGLAGMLSGGLVTVLASLASGSLGDDRLAHVGALVRELAVFAPALLGLAGLAAGLILGAIRRPTSTMSEESVHEHE